jgi:hypothetical protein
MHDRHLATICDCSDTSIAVTKHAYSLASFGQRSDESLLLNVAVETGAVLHPWHAHASMLLARLTGLHMPAACTCQLPLTALMMIDPTLGCLLEARVRAVHRKHEIHGGGGLV